MLVDSIAGAFLVAGAVACAGAVIARRPVPGARAVLALALAAAGAAALAGEAEPGAIAACALATVAAAVLVLVRCGPVSRLSWLDAAMGASATAALAVALGAGATAAVGDRRRGRRARALALAPGPHRRCSCSSGWSRWPPSRGARCPRRSSSASPPGCPSGRRARARSSARSCSPRMLAYASIALTLLGVGQFTDIEPVAIALAIATVLVGMARAGLTVIERLRDSQEQAMTDDLTGLGNRRHLVDTLHATIESSGANGDELALLLIDLDGFKELNDTLGHHAGDEVLRQIGPRLKELLRDDDTLARLGGDEFAVILQPGDEATGQHRGPAAARGARAVVRGRRHPRPHRRQHRHRALPEPRATDAMGLLQRADVAMYQAKRMRTGHEVYLAGRDRHSRQRLALVGELGAALEAGELVLHYQPKAELRSGHVRGVEALVRWEHPERGLLGPGHFLPLVEQSGLTRALTAFVLDRALDEIGRLRLRGQRPRRRGQPRARRPARPRPALGGRAPARSPPLPARPARDRGVGGHRDGRRRAHRRRARRPARDRRRAPRSTTSAPATPGSPTSRSCTSTCSRSTARSSCGSPTTSATPRSSTR